MAGTNERAQAVVANDSIRHILHIAHRLWNRSTVSVSLIWWHSPYNEGSSGLVTLHDVPKVW